MGIRIHKSIGYGLDLAKIDGFNSESFSEAYSNFAEYKPADLYNDMLAGYNEHDSNDDRLDRVMIKQCEGKISPYEHVIYDEEFGAPDFVQFIPVPFQKRENGWRHYDDQVDYYEFFARYGSDPENWSVVEWIEGRNLYPYNNYMRKDDTKSFGVGTYYEDAYRVQRDARNGKVHIPAVPLHILVTMKLMNFVPENKLVDTFMLLKPSIYTYWS